MVEAAKGVAIDKELVVVIKLKIKKPGNQGPSGG
jgi:hypothetical protein